jgi:heme-degrading monooxygenase HmoA
VDVAITIKPQAQEALNKTYVETFRPAITRQEGFRDVKLLRPLEGGDDYRLHIAFDSHALQQKWVAMDLHQDVWPQMESHFAEYTVKFYNTVE